MTFPSLSVNIATKRRGFSVAVPATIFRTVLRTSSSLHLLHSRRQHTNLNGAFAPQQYTKYRLTKPFDANVDFQDPYLTDPERKSLVKITKDEPLFLRFLKLVAEQEGRPSVFADFARRCENGLVVEKDIYITKQELLDCLWEHGFSDLELSAYEIAFPPSYRFHYPELAVLFDLTEKQCYEFCLRKRAADPSPLVEVEHKATPRPGNAVASYGVLSTGLWFGLQHNAFGNIWMLVKTWPFFAVIYMLISHFQKQLLARFYNATSEENAIALENKLEGEDKVYSQMKKYANDSLCLEYLQSFKPGVISQLENYRAAALLQMRHRLVEGMTRHLTAIHQAETSVHAKLQQVIVDETVAAFRLEFAADRNLKDAAMASALDALGRLDEVEVADPVGHFFRNSFKEMHRPAAVASNSKADETSGEWGLQSHLPNRHSVKGSVENVFHQLESEFLNSFSVTAAEAAEVKSVVSRITTQDQVGRKVLDFSRADIKDVQKLEDLFERLNAKVGLQSRPAEMLPFASNAAEAEHSSEAAFATAVAHLTSDAHHVVKQRRLGTFASAFM